MHKIYHRIGTRTEKPTVLAALSSLQGLAQWWTVEVTGDPNEGGVLKFRFNGQGPDFKVLACNDQRITWQCIDGPEEWLQTQVDFKLVIESDDETIIYFEHSRWQKETPFKAHGSMKWATFLLSLKNYLETGEGMPFPNDIQIDNA